MEIKHGSLFSGIGGFDLAAQWCGWENIFQVEIDDFCQKRLLKNFPGIKKYRDIRGFDGTEYKGTIDVLSGGPPCQPASLAGKRRGTADDRWLWQETLRVMFEIEPTWAIFENPPGLLTLERGMVFEKLLSQMESKGYEVQSYLIPACAVDAPHWRERLWIIAHSNSMGLKSTKQQKFIQNENREFQAPQQSRNVQQCGIGQSDCYVTDIESQNDREYIREAEKRQISESGDCFESGIITDFNVKRLEKRKSQRIDNEEKFSTVIRGDWSEDWYEVASRLCRVDDGVPDRVDRIRALGNAVVPQLVYEIFKAIEENF